MPQKPGKYGILFRVITDARARYVSKMIPYAGRCEDKGANSSAQIVRQHSEHIRGSGRNITMDRYYIYTTVDLAEELVKERNLMVLGTIQSNRKGIPEEFKQAKGRDVHSTLFAFSGECMLISYVPKKGKVVLMLSTEHDSPQVSDRKDKKPQTILDYNEAKGGVDTVDMMINTYRSKAATRRWPMVVWTTMIDVAALDGFLIWRETHPDWEQRRRNAITSEYLKQLGFQLVQPQVQARSDVPGLSSCITLTISTVLRKPIPGSHNSSRVQTTRCRGRCCVCVSEAKGPGSKKAKYNKACKVSQICSKCHRNVCMKHSVKDIVCTLCLGSDESN